MATNITDEKGERIGHKLPYTLTTDWRLMATWLLIPIVCSIALGFIFQQRIASSTAWALALWPCYVTFPIALYGHFCRVSLLIDRICATTPFRKCEIFYRQIKQINVLHQRNGNRGGFLWLELTLLDEAFPTKINISYNETQIPKLVSLVISQAPHAAVTQFAAEVSQGRMP